MDSLDNDVVPPFNTCQGSWRPDFLLEDVHSDEGIRICEINSRFALNGFFHTAFCQQAYIEMDDRTNCLTTPAARPKDASAVFISRAKLQKLIVHRLSTAS